MLGVNVSSTIWLTALEGFCALLALVAISAQSKNLKWVRLYLATKIITVIMLAPIGLTRLHWMTLQHQYRTYFYAYWSCFLIGAILTFAVITEVFQLALEPLPGLRRLGMLVFRWVAAISVMIAFAASISPTMTSQSFIASVAGELQRAVGLLQICLLAFMYIVAKPLGMSYRSRLLGLSMGLALLSVADIVYSAWFNHNPSMYSTINLFHAVAPALAFLVWTAHFILPEPARAPIMLPVASPLLRWNEIAQSLGKSGGRVLLTHKAEIAGKDFDALDKAIALLNNRAS